jgi:hypothetical protein
MDTTCAIVVVSLLGGFWCIGVCTICCGKISTVKPATPHIESLSHTESLSHIESLSHTESPPSYQETTPHIESLPHIESPPTYQENIPRQN